MISQILIAVDGSAHALKAVEFSSQIAVALKAKVTLLYVAKRLEVPEAMKQFAKAEHFAERDADILEVMKHGAQQVMAAAAEKLRADGVAEVVTEVREGPIARTIVARGEQIGADMIVMGSRGLGDIQGLLRGGVSHRVEILAKCPVLIVK